MKLLMMMVCWVGLCVAGIAQHLGQPDHPMNKLTSNIDILNYWDVDSETKQFFQSASAVLTADPQADYRAVLEDPVFQSVQKAQNRPFFGGPMLGHVRSDGVAVWMRTTRERNITVQVFQNQRLVNTYHGQSTLENELVAVIELLGLQPEQRYTYEIQLDSEQPIRSDHFKFSTSAPVEEADASRLIFGSCPHRWGLGNTQMLDLMIDRQPDGVVLLGDIAVQDRMNDIGKHKADYLMRDQLPAWRKLSGQIPIYASWDDHDYFGNDLAGVPSGYTVADKERVAKEFRASWNNPPYAQNADKEGIYLKTQIGLADLIMTDNRYYRTGEPGSFLGEQQMQWLKETLKQCSAPFIIVSCGSMWSDYVSKGKDSWGVNDPEGREELFQWIEDQGIKGVIFISGDRHGARGFTIPRRDDFEFYEFEAASLGARIGPPAKKDEWDTQLYGIDGQYAFGEITMKQTKGDASLIYRLIREDGTVLYQKELQRSVDLSPE